MAIEVEVHNRNGPRMRRHGLVLFNTVPLLRMLIMVKLYKNDCVILFQYQQTGADELACMRAMSIGRNRLTNIQLQWWRDHMNDGLPPISANVEEFLYHADGNPPLNIQPPLTIPADCIWHEIPYGDAGPPPAGAIAPLKFEDLSYFMECLLQL